MGGHALSAAQRSIARRRWWYLLFLVQFVAVLWPPFYNRIEPTWLGLPYFYWYQLLWVAISALVTALIYWVTVEDR